MSSTRESIGIGNGASNPDHRYRRKFNEGTVRLKPNETRRLPLGSYPKSEHQPRFDVAVTPGIGEQLGVSLERIDMSSAPRYILFYSFHNFSEKPCEVIVTRCED